MLPTEKRERRHKSSIFEMNTESLMLTDILDALKTEQVELEPPEDSRQQTIEFLKRMLGHLKELCLTKMSTKDVESLTEAHIENVATLPLNTALTHYFGEMMPEVERLVQRLKRVSHKKFTVLIRRKISEMFTEIMRHTYQMKLAVVVEKLRQKQQQRQATQTLVNMVMLLDRKTQLQYAFWRVKSLQTATILHRKTIFDAVAKSLNNLDRICQKRNIRQKAGYFGVWRHHAKLMGSETTSQINNLIKTIYLSLVSTIEDEHELHSVINLSLKKIAGNEAAHFKLFKPLESTLLFFDGEEQPDENPHVVAASDQELACLELGKDSMVCHNKRDQKIMLVAVSSASAEPVGLFCVPLQQDLDSKTLENIIELAKGIGEMLSKVYRIRNRLTYYDRDCRSLNHIAESMFGRLLDMIGEVNWEKHLDVLLAELHMNHFEIIFLEGATHESFYKYSPEDSQYVGLTASAVALFKDEFQKPSANPFICVNRGEHLFTIFPVWEEGVIKGLIKFSYPFEVSTSSLVETVEVFVRVLIGRSSPKLSSLPEIDQPGQVNSLSPRVQIAEQGLQILKARSCEEVSLAFNRAVEKVSECTKMNYYACVLWPVLVSKHPQCYWTHSQTDEILTIDSKHSVISAVTRTAKAIDYFSVANTDELATLLKKFALYGHSKLAEYEKYLEALQVRAVPVRNRHSEMLCIVLVATLGNTLEPAKTEENSLMQIRDFIRACLKGIADTPATPHLYEEHETQAAREFHRLATTFEVDHINFYESMDRMINALASGSYTRVYRLERNCLVQHFTGERFSWKPLQGPVLPKQPYCSHDKSNFSEYRLRFKNKLAVSSKKISIGFRSAALKQQYLSLVESITEEEATALQELAPEMTTLEQTLGLASTEYLYLPVDLNTFIVITSPKKWTGLETDLLHRFVVKEHQQHSLFRRGMLMQMQQIALKEVIQLKKVHQTRQLHKAVRQFSCRYQLVRARNRRFCEIIKELTQRAVSQLSKTFESFKVCSAGYKCRVLSTGAKLNQLEQCLQVIYCKRIFAQLAQGLKKHRNSTENLLASLHYLSHRIKGEQRNLTAHCFQLLHRFANQALLANAAARRKALLRLGSIFSLKEKQAYKLAMNCLSKRWNELVAVFTVVTEELEIVQFSNQRLLLSFLEERIGQTLERLHEPFNNLTFSVSIAQQTERKGMHFNNGYFILDDSQPHIVTVGWELNEEEFIVVTLSRKLRLSSDFMNNLLKLRQIIASKHARLKQQTRTKLQLLCCAYNHLSSSNLQTALRLLHRHARRAIKQQNRKARLSAKEVEAQLAELSQESESNKENESLQREIISQRRVISDAQENFESLKLDNKVKRKTLSVAQVLTHQQQLKEQARKCEYFVRRLDQTVEMKKLASERDKENSIIDRLRAERLRHGFKRLYQIEHCAAFRTAKHCFEHILGEASKNSRALR